LVFLALVLTIALVGQSFPASASPPVLALSASSSTVSPGATVDLTAGMPVVGAGTVSQEIVQSIDPTKVQLTSVSDIKYPNGWTLSYSTDGSSFSSTAPTTTAGWAAVRSVKATGSINSQGAENGYQIAAGTATGTAVNLSPATIPASGGGDGYQAFFDPARTRVFNVFHHKLGAAVDCHVLATGSTCAGFPFGTFPSKTGQYSTGRVVGTKIWMPMYEKVYANNNYASSSVGFSCVDIAAVLVSGGAPSMCNPAYVPLATGQDVHTGQNFVVASEQELFAIRSIDGVSTAGSAEETRLWSSLPSNGKVICLDTATAAPCAGMPANGWPTAVKGWKLNGSYTVGGYFTSLVVADGRIYVEGSSSTTNTTNGNLTIACVLESDPVVACPGFTGGKDLGPNSAQNGPGMVGNLVELPAADGSTAGVCLLGDTRSLAYGNLNQTLPASSTAAVPCWDAAGTSFAGPASLSTMVTSAFSYGFVEYQQPLRVGSRIYWGNGINFNGSADYPGRAFCWDASKASGSGGPCANLPATGYATDNYSVTPDPAIPDCMWVTRHEQPNLRTYNMVGNSVGCSSIAPTRASFPGGTVVPRMACTTNPDAVRAWRSFTLTSPAPSATFTAKLSVKDSSGAAIASWTDVPITAGSATDLSSLSPTLTGVAPSFEVNFTVSSGSISSATARVEAIGDAPELCLSPTAVLACPSGFGPLSGLSGSSVTVSASGSSTDVANVTTPLDAVSTTFSVSAPSGSQCGASLTGSALISGSASGVAGATVSLLDSSGNPVVDGQGNPVSTTTASDGSYTFGYLFPGSYKVQFADQGLRTVASTTVANGGSGSTTDNTSATSLVSTTTTLSVGTNGVVNSAYNTVATALPDTSSGVQGAPQTIDVLANDVAGSGNNLASATIRFCSTDSPPTGCTLTTKTVAGEGEYSLSGSDVVFTPCSAANTPSGASCTGPFIGNATTVAYEITDSGGQISTSTISPTVVPPPTAVADVQTGGFDANQTYTPASNDSAGLGTSLVASSVRLCPTSTASPFTSSNCNATTVTTADGVYTLDVNTGTVVFDPTNTFTGVATLPVNYVVADALGQYASATITPTVTPPGASVANANSTIGVSGVAQSVDLLANDSTPAGVSLTSNSTRLCASGVSAPNCVATTLDVPNVGTYTLSNGTVTFTPCTTAVTANCSSGAAYSGSPAALGYQVTDSLGRVVSSTYTPTVVPLPTAVADAQTGGFDVNQTYTPSSNDTAGLGTTLDGTSVRLCATNATAPFTPNNCSATSVTTPDGVYALDSATGVVTFDPANTFTGPATVPVKYVVADGLGQYASSTITPTVTPPALSVATSNTTTGIVGASQIVNLLTNDSAPNGVTLTASSTRLCAPGTNAPNCVATTVDVTNVGTYSLMNSTVTFIPCTSTITVNCTTGVAFTGTPTALGYQVSDSLGRVVSSTYTPTVVAPPTASGDGSQGVKGQPQTIALITNDVPGDGVAPLDPTTIRLCDSSETAPNCTLQTLTISGEGTYTINPSGTVTFTPDPDFVGSSTPQRYVVADILGQVTDATIQPNVVPPPAPITADDSEIGPADTPMTIDPLANDSAGTLPAGLSGEVNLVRSSLRLCDRSELAPNCTATQLTTADGTYTVDTATGFVTFTPRNGFTGQVTQPVTYQIANDWTGPSGVGIATAVITPIIDPAAPPVPMPGLPGSTSDNDDTRSTSFLPATGTDIAVTALWGAVLIGSGALLGGLHRRNNRI
jgi:CshA-type fibril repeat protein